MKLIKDLGMVYATNKSKTKKHYGVYECHICLSHIRTCTHNVNNGESARCKACATKSHKTKHGDRRDRVRVYGIWSGIKTRCYNKNANSYKNYGAKGIVMCDEWKDNYLAFKKWALENGYSDDLCIDKDIKCEELNISPKIYSPNTCVWITESENSIDANKRRAK